MTLISCHLRQFGNNPGLLVESDSTDKVFTNPQHKLTEDYITGRIG